jgi:hypothetical protein
MLRKNTFFWLSYFIYFLLTLAGLAQVMSLRKLELRDVGMFELREICATARYRHLGTAPVCRQPGTSPPPNLEATEGTTPSAGNSAFSCF